MKWAAVYNGNPKPLVIEKPTCIFIWGDEILSVEINGQDQVDFAKGEWTAVAISAGSSTHPAPKGQEP